MHRRLLPAAAALLGLLPSAAPAQDAAPRTRLAFEVDVTKPGSGRIRVAMKIAPVRRDEIRVAIPAWAPGAYRIVKYAKAVRGVEARDGEGAALEVAPADGQTWRIAAGGARAVVVTYELVVEKSRMDEEHCYLAGPDTYFYLVGDKGTPCSVRFRLPEGWRVGTGLEERNGRYGAPDYDTFIDCPTELGTFDLLEFEADGAAYQLVIHSVGPVKGDVLVEMCRKIVLHQNALFGGPPFDRYVFIYHFDNRLGGRGLEHLNSTDISLSYPAVRIQPLIAASVTSHEYYHAWNVKRIRPVQLGPFDYTRPVPTKALWMCEGVTSYFGDRTLVRTKIWSEAVYLRHLAREIQSLQNNPDRRVTSVEKASWSVWTRKDYPRVDYYNKGELLGMLIDLKIRTRSKGANSLDRVMRDLYRKYVEEPAAAGKGPIGVGFPEGGILESLERVTGREWDDFYARYVSGTEELPYAGVMEPAGLKVDLDVSRHAGFGVSLRGTTVVSVPTGGPADGAGLRRGDRIREIDGTRVSRGTILAAIRRLKIGATAKVKVDRGPGTREIPVPVVRLERTACTVRRSREATDFQKRLLDAWLHGRTEY